MTRLGLLALAIPLAASCGREEVARICPDQFSGTWLLEASAPTGETLRGSISTMEEGEVIADLTWTPPEGPSEIYRYRAVDFVLTADSIRFLIPPIEFAVEGSCNEGQHFDVAYSHPEPGTEGIIGTGVLTWQEER
jgi:hypothetical protein